jgi:uncharacterized delta-60 repeat protein
LLAAHPLQHGMAMTVRWLVSMSLLGCGQVSTTPPDGGGDPQAQLAISIEPAPRFVRTGAQLAVPVTVVRDGVVGPVTVTLDAPPPGVTTDPLTLDASTGELVLHVADDAAFARLALTVSATAGTTSGTAALAVEVIGTPGTPDPTFGTAGSVTFAGSDKLEIPQFAIAQGDQVVVGIALERAGRDGVLVVRRGRDGAPDPTFGTAGEVFVDLATIGITSNVVARAAAQPDGKLVIAGSGLTASDGDPFVVRLTTDGQIDSGLALRKLDLTTASISIAGVTIGPAGELVVVGHKAAGTGTDGIVIRTDAGGTRDPGFGSNGIATFAEKTSDDIVSAIVQPDGRIVALVSTSNNGQFEFPEYSLRRFGTAGQLDATFGSAGKALLPTPEGFSSATVLVSPDRLGLYVAGGVRQSFTGSDRAVWRYLADGRLDLGFGAGLGYYAAPASMPSDSLTSLLIGEDGTLYGVGVESDAIAAVARIAILHLDAAGVPDPGFGSAGVALDPTAVVPRAAALRTDHRLVIVAAPVFVDDASDTTLRGYWN